MCFWSPSQFCSSERNPACVPPDFMFVSPGEELILLWSEIPISKIATQTYSIGSLVPQVFHINLTDSVPLLQIIGLGCFQVWQSFHIKKILNKETLNWSSLKCGLLFIFKWLLIISLVPHNILTHGRETILKIYKLLHMQFSILIQLPSFPLHCMAIPMLDFCICSPCIILMLYRPLCLGQSYFLLLFLKCVMPAQTNM